MERQIKFRGKEINSGLWVYGFYVQGSFIDPVNNTEEVRHIIHSDVLCDVEEDSVAQFTGLHDKDGKEIYEGDDIIVNGRLFGVVRWHEDGYFFIDDSIVGISLASDYTPLGEMIRHFERFGATFSVIGIDNPELLKGGNP